MEKAKIIEDLQQKFPDGILSVAEQFGDDIIHIKKESLLGIIEFLKKDPYAFTMLLDLTCVDYLGEAQRFEMVYHIFSLANKLRFRLKVRLTERNFRIDSLTPIFRNANWLEREAFDMFGVRFIGHPYLHRLFMYEGFEGHPLRKDYPLRKQQPKIPLRS